MLQPISLELRRTYREMLSKGVISREEYIKVTEAKTLDELLSTWGISRVKG